MKKVMVFVLMLSLMMPVFALTPAFAAEGSADVGNKLCPISGDPVSGSSFVEYGGKRYGLCCPACKSMFLADPVKYIAKMNAQEKSAAPAVAADAVKSEQMQKNMEQGSL